MSTGSLLVNSAHEPGLTRLEFSRNGKKLYTAGEDGLVRVWDTSKDAMQEPKVVSDADEGVTSLSCSKDAWLSASQDSQVRKYNGETDDMEALVTRSPAVTIRCIAVSPDDRKVAVTSDELIVKVIDLRDTLSVHLLSGHIKGVRSATWHPFDGTLTTSGQDGTINIWTDTSKDAPEPSHAIDGIIPSVDTESPEFLYDVSAIWHPHGRYFVTVNRTHDIVAISSDSWSNAGMFSKGAHASPVTCLSFSPNGLYLASAAADGQVFIWDTVSRAVLFRRKDASRVAILTMRFSPIVNHLAWTDADGTLTRWGTPIPSTHRSPIGLTNGSSSNSTSGAKIPDKEKGKIDFDDFDDVDDKVIDALNAPNDEDDLPEDWIIDDEDNGYKKDVMAEAERGPRGLRKMVNVTKAQPAFQPGSTPFQNKKRYLAFNMIGVIEATDQDTHQIINVEFHDKSLRRGYHFQDHFRYHLASLGPRGALFACLPEGTNAAQIQYRPFDTWASAAEWQIPLPPGEVPVAICAGGAPYKKNRSTGDDDDDELGPSDAGGAGYAIVATTAATIRFWLGTGIQTYVWHIGGEIVAMEAGAEWVFVIHREGGTSLDGCQNLKYTLMSLDSYDIINTGSVPLAKGVTLRWVGITSDGAPAIYDSYGMLSILDRFRRPTQGRWVPALDTNTLARKVGKDESYWAVGLSAKEFMCIILKGRQEYPTFPLPLIQEIEVNMPLLGLDTPQGQAEERIVREKIQVGMLKDGLPPDVATTPEIHAQQLELDKALIMLIQGACKSDKLERALDYTSMLHHLASFDLAQKVAEFYHLPGLKEKMGALRDFREAAEEDGEERDVRSGWGRIAEPVPRAGVASFDYNSQPNGTRRGSDYGASHSRRSNGLAHFEEFRPPPAVPRRSLAAASPNIPPQRTIPPMPSSPPPSARTVAGGNGESNDGFFSDNYDTGREYPTYSKRKRDEDANDEIEIESLQASPKKKASPAVARTPFSANGPPKSVNPFARKKPTTDTPNATAPTSSNPFAKKAAAGGAQRSVTAVKSNSFFEKVDAAEAAVAPRPKGRATALKDASTKKDGKVESGVKQTKLSGLFGLPEPAPPSAKPAARKTKEKDSALEVQKDVNGPNAKQSPDEGDDSQATQVDLTTTIPDDNAMRDEESQETLEATPLSSQVLAEQGQEEPDQAHEHEARDGEGDVGEEPATRAYSPDWDVDATQDEDVEMEGSGTGPAPIDVKA